MSGIFGSGAFAAIKALFATTVGAGLSGYAGNLAYDAGTIGAHFKGEINITDFPWLVKCDSNGAAGNGTDNAAAVQAAFAFASANGYGIYHPGGVCRVTSGFVLSTAYHNLIIRGNGPVDEPYLGNAGASTFLLDSIDPASFFISQENAAGGTALKLDGVTFKCAQFVAERQFIKSSGYLYHHSVQNCTFTAVEQPFTYLPGGYFQNASYRNVMFLNSGTFHSKCSTAVGSLVGTLMTLDNVNHEGSIPVNAEKKVCNLTGIRQIEARNFLLEGALPAAGWTVLKLANPYDAYYARQSTAVIVNFHSEWGGFAPDYVVEQVGGLVSWKFMVGVTVLSKYKLSDMARVVMEQCAFSGTDDEPSLMFERDTTQCTVEFRDCTARTIDLNKTGFSHHGTQWANITDGSGQVVLSNTGAQELWRWNGAHVSPNGSGADAELSGAATVYPSTDATYGRKLVFAPAAGALGVGVRLKSHGALRIGDQIMFTFRAKLPTYAAGLWAFKIDVDNGANGGATVYFDSTKSGTVVEGVVCLTLKVAPTTITGVFSNGTTAGAVGDLEVIHAAIHQGQTLPRHQVSVFPLNVTTQATAAPVVGGWVKNDITINSNPAVGSPKAWRCTVTGTPGTWVSEGNL